MRANGSRGPLFEVLVLCAVAATVAPGLLGAESPMPPPTPPAVEPTPVALPGTEVRYLRSEIVGQEYRLWIARPMVPMRGERKLPVLYLLDADISFALVRQVVFSLQSGRELPPMLIVAVGYPGGFREGMIRRTRDYTPTPDPVFTSFARQWGSAEPGPGGSGGAAAFLRFIREELKPFVEANYPADPGDATIFGHSFGGLFAVYALLEAPGTFQRVIAGSPSLWWGRRGIFDVEKRYAAAHEDLQGRVFFAVGGRETTAHEEEMLALLPEPERKSMTEFQEAIDGGAQMLEVVEPFVERLAGRGYPSLDIELKVFADETHASVPPMIISRGLRVVFETF